MLSTCTDITHSLVGLGRGPGHTRQGDLLSYLAQFI